MHALMHCVPLPSPASRRMSHHMVQESPLDDPENAAYAWQRFRLIMRWLAAATGTTVLIVVGGLWFAYPEASIHFFIAASLGIAMTMGLGGALMALVFMSNGTGHDEAVDNRLPDAEELFGDRSDER